MKYATFIEYGNRDSIAEIRPAHREYLGKLRESGQLAASGPFTDDSGALIIYEADSEEEAVQLLEADPFRQAGVFQSYTMKPWNQVF
ncbi:MAG: YciI family protein [Thermomicrobiales bacterium]